MKSRVLFLLIVIATFFSRTYTVNAECTVGVVAGKASADGRPISFKNRDFDFAYQGVVYVSSGKYKYIGIGNSGSSAMMGLNEKGVGLGNSVMSDLNGGGGNVTCMDWLLKNCATAEECKTALKNDSYAGSKPSFSLPIIGQDGKAFHVEKGASYYEYDPLNCGLDKVRKYAIIARTNNGHQNSDGTDDASTGGQRYYEARDHLHNAVIRKGIFDTDPLDSTGVTIAEVIQTLRWGNPGYEGGWQDATSRNCNSTSLSTMIVHGINQNEDPRISVMWSTVYKADYVAFVPVWVESGIRNELPQRIVVGNDARGLSFQADRIYNKKDASNYDQYINARLEPMEANFIQAVADARQRWVVKGFVYEEAKRICNEAVETSYWTLKTLADKAQTNPRDLNKTPLLTEIKTTIQQKTVQFSQNASDSDGTIDSVYWEFGDGAISLQANPSHTYTAEGSYLTMCRAVDNSGSRNSRWRYVTIDGVAIAAAKKGGAYRQLLLVTNQLQGAVGFTIQVEKGSDYALAIYTVKGQQLWLHHGTAGNTGSDEVRWYSANTPYSAGNRIYVAKLTQGGVQSVKKFVMTK